MNLILNKIKSIFSSKISIQTYFILFILLNILDFFNYLPLDIDFFKKLLSWSIIAYIFYKLSVTKIFIGKKIKKYDLLFILGFSLMSIVKSLALYTSQGIYKPEQYYIFNYILTPISNLNPVNLINNSFILGLILIIFLSIFLIKNNKVNKNSFLGSFYFNDYLILILFAIFFGLIIFNIFMEWFALAVDSVILVLGLIFYLFKYFHDHSKNKYSNYLRVISNTGNNFYNKLILTFSNRKTIFIGISFLLTIHLLVDVGVYMIPYSIGTQNTLYFDSLNVEGVVEHTPLFNFFNFENSQIFKDLNSTDNSILLFIVILIYLISSFLIISIMILPFYVLYKNIQKEKIKFNNFFAILFLISVSFLFLILK